MERAPLPQVKIKELRTIEQFFNTSTNCLNEEDSSFRPTEGQMTVSQQIAHVARTIDWFTDALTDPKGFDLDFESHLNEAKKCNSLNEARKWFARSISRTVAVLETLSEEALMAPLPQGPVMGGAPKIAILGAISDHTAHHRGALTVYSRLLGKTPEMPYA